MDQLHIPLTEKLKSIPEIFGVRLNEEPDYEVLHKEGKFEIRKYAVQLTASITLKDNDFDRFKNLAFERLAKFIFGGNLKDVNLEMTSPVLQKPEGAETMAMTAPVFQSQNGDYWTMTFILPKKYNLNTVPKPLDSEIHLEEVPPYFAAAARYSGNNTLERMEKYRAELGQWLEKRNDVRPTGKFFSAQYDAPFVIPFLKRNEVQIKLQVLQ